jgi:hypothetical protein
MGSLTRFPLSTEFVKRFPIFIETGYGDGHGISYAAQHNFIQLYSIEIQEPSARKGKELYKDDHRVDVMCLPSPEGLEVIFNHEDFHDSKRPIFFWLDAHFPGMDYYSEPFDKYPKDIRLPLEQELDIIRRRRPDGDYFILIDDLRFYADYDWGDGIIPEHFRRALPTKRSLDFLDPFHNTHCVSIDLRDSGYALIGPHDAPFLEFKD